MGEKRRGMMRAKKMAAMEQQKENTTYIQSPQQFHQEETENETKLTIDVAGFAASDLQIRFKNGVLALRGKRQNKLGETFILGRRVRLRGSSFDEDNIKADFDEGVLEIT